MWCFITTKLRPDERCKLVEADIGFADYTFKSKDSRLAGITVPDEQLEQTLQLLKLTNRSSNEAQEADKQGVQFVLVSPTPEPAALLSDPSLPPADQPAAAEAPATDRQRYIELCRIRFKDEKKSASKGLEAAELALEGALEAFIQAQRSVETARRRQRGLAEGSTAVMAELLEGYGREYDLLCNSPDIESFKLSNSKLTVATRPIKIRHKGVTYKMGRYGIVIDTEKGSIAIKGRHPHVDNKGKPCLGNIGTGVAKLVARRQYGILIPVLIRYLESYYPPDAYREIQSETKGS